MKRQCLWVVLRWGKGISHTNEILRIEILRNPGLVVKLEEEKCREIERRLEIN